MNLLYHSHLPRCILSKLSSLPIEYIPFFFLLPMSFCSPTVYSVQCIQCILYILMEAMNDRELMLQADSVDLLKMKFQYFQKNSFHYMYELPRACSAVKFPIFTL